MQKEKNLPQNQFINTIVRVNNVNNANGLCLGHAEKASGVFESIYDPKQESLVKKEFTKDQIKFARHICRQRLVPRANLRNCQDLYLNTESIEFIKTITDLKKHITEAKREIAKRKIQIIKRKKQQHKARKTFQKRKKMIANLKRKPFSKIRNLIVHRRRRHHHHHHKKTSSSS